FTCFFEDLFRKLVRKIELSDSRKRVDPRTATRPKHLRNHPFAPVFRRREANYFDDNLVVGTRSFGAGISDKDAVAKDRAVYADPSLAVALQVSADKLPCRPLQNL